MLISGSQLINTPILSLQTGSAVAWTKTPIIDPDKLQIIAFETHGPLVDRAAENILDVRSVREYSRMGMVIDSIEELVAPGDVIKIEKILKLNFDLIGLKVETKKGTKLGRVIDFTVSDGDLIVQQIIVKRPAMKALIDPELVISRQEIVEINDYKIIVKDEEKVIRERATNEDFVPNFVNPFRKTRGQDFAPAQNQNPDEPSTV